MKPKQLYFVLLGLIGLITVGTLGAYYMLHGTLNAKIASLKKISGDITLENEQIDRIKKLEKDLREIEPLAEKAQAVLPQQKQQDEVVAQISTIVRNNGLSISGLTFEATKGLPDDKSQTEASSISGILLMPVHFNTVSTYQQLTDLLLSFERQQRFMRVATLDISRIEGGSITTNISLEVFLKP